MPMVMAVLRVLTDLCSASVNNDNLSEKELGIGCCYEVVAKFRILFK